jgi:hypothetical protein
LTNPKYPVYVISKGRAESRITIKSLERMKVPYTVAVEPQEFEDYNKYIPKENILVTNFSNVGCGIPVRNFIWDHAVKNGYEKHWCIDDNIADFYRLHKNLRIRVESGVFFKIMEDFSDRFENVMLSGPQYRFFIAPNGKYPAFVANTRVYSCLLINHKCKHRWRGRYNEDTDLSLRVLKDGDCTIQFNAFLQGKNATMTTSGGNTDELYASGEAGEKLQGGDDTNTKGRLLMAESLRKQHPDVAFITWKYNRWHHYVNYEPFKKNELIYKNDFQVPQNINNYGLKLIKSEKFRIR